MNNRNSPPLGFAINGRLIGPDQPPYVIAELSANHVQDLQIAKELVLASAHAGVDAVKLQTYTASTMTMNVARTEYLMTEGPWKGERLFDLYARAETPWEWLPELQELALSNGITLFSSPFDLSAVEFLEANSVPAYKIASFELTDIPLIQSVAATGRPIIMSTGMATKREIADAVNAVRDIGRSPIALLKCTSSYPAPIIDQNLVRIPAMMRDFGVVAGFSDHTVGSTAAIAAVALGASIVEKHVRTRGSEASPDAGFSMGTNELSDYVGSIRDAYAARGVGAYGPAPSETPLLRFRRSVIAARPLRAGKKLDSSDFLIRRPDIGASPSDAHEMIGRTLRRNIELGDGIQLGDLE